MKLNKMLRAAVVALLLTCGLLAAAPVPVVRADTVTPGGGGGTEPYWIDNESHQEMDCTGMFYWTVTTRTSYYMDGRVVVETTRTLTSGYNFWAIIALEACPNT